MYNSGFVPGFLFKCINDQCCGNTHPAQYQTHKWSPLTATRPSASESSSVFKEPSVPGAAAGKTVK